MGFVVTAPGQRPPAEAVAAVLAPAGMLQAPKAHVALDVRCRCQELLVRLLRTPVGLLRLSRSHHRPTWKHLRAKGDDWDGGERHEPTVVHDERGTRVPDGLTFVGWEEGASWYDVALPRGGEAGKGSFAGVDCRCGLFLDFVALEPSVAAILARPRDRVLLAPSGALLDPAAKAALIRGAHEQMVADHLSKNEQT